MTNRIFISYRRDDTSGYAGRLFDRLIAAFGRDRVFMDIEAIEPGSDFVDTIDKAVGSCGALVAVIGKGWLQASDDQGRRRLDNPNDFIRIEVASALKRDVRIVPLLVNGAVMPQATELPEDMAGLSRRQALELSDIRWDYDVGRLIDFLDRHLDKAGLNPDGSGTEATQAIPRTPSHNHRQRRPSERKHSARGPVSIMAVAGLAVAITAGLSYVALRPAAEDIDTPATPRETAATETLRVESTVPPNIEPDGPAPERLGRDPGEALVASETQHIGAIEQPPVRLPLPSPSVVPPTDAATGDTQMSPAAAVERLLVEAEADVAARRLTRPRGNNAFERYSQVLELRPGHAGAVQGLTRVAETYQIMAGDAFAADRHEQGITLLSKAAEVVSVSPELAALGNDIEAQLASRRAEHKAIEARAAGRRAEQMARTRARESCLQQCEDAALSCREQAPVVDPEQCRKDVERRCLAVYDDCLPQALIFGQTSAESECTGRQIACEEESLPQCGPDQSTTATQCEQQAEACQRSCPE